MTRRWLLLLLIPGVALGWVTWRDWSSVQTVVVRIIDADTVTVLLLGQETSVRIAHIDAPETMRQQTCAVRLGIGDADAEMALGEAATEALGSLLASAGGAVRLSDVRTGDRYGRTLAAIQAGEIDVGDWLVAQGFAVPYEGAVRDGWCN